MIIEKTDVVSIQAFENYQKNQDDLTKTIEDFYKLILPIYKEEYPFRFLSHYRLKRFLKLLERLILIPDIDEFIDISIHNELYDADVYFMFYTKKQPVAIKIPFIVNITKLNTHLKKYATTVCFQVNDLEKVIYPKCFEEYEFHMHMKKIGGDLLENIKSKNQVMVMNSGIANDLFLINGTHRTIGAIKNGDKEIKGYYVDSKLCSQFALTSDFNRLFKALLKLYRKVYIGRQSRTERKEK